MRRIPLRERVTQMGLLDTPATMRFYAERAGTPARRYPDAQAMLQKRGLDLTGDRSSKELTRAYVREFVKLNNLKA